MNILNSNTERRNRQIGLKTTATIARLIEADAIALGGATRAFIVHRILMEHYRSRGLLPTMIEKPSEQSAASTFSVEHAG
jgi:hypothetical protein